MNVVASFDERVVFNTELSPYTHKGTQHLEYLRNLALKTIHKVQSGTLQIYTDGNMGVGAVSGGGIFIKKWNGIRICNRNPNYYSVFWAELLAIAEALKCCFTESINTDIWVFSDSHRSIQHLSEWRRHGDRTTASITQL
ncbi:uncharacterized protein TNCV_136891 [Trichonephila clavipes]|nr:uncharacterized protein TNCV_136891 [Trichonephila clavipes]